MKKKTFILIVLALALLTSLVAGCGGGGQATNPPQTSKAEAGKTDTGTVSIEDKKVTMILKNNVNPFWVRIEEGSKEAAQKIGMNLSILAPMTNDSNEEQMQLVEQAIVDKSDVIIIAPADAQGIIPAAKKVTEANIPLVVLNSNIAGDDAFWETFVGIDHVDIGKQTMAELAKRLDGKGDIIILEGVAGSETSYGRIEGAKAVLKEHPDMKVVAQQAADFSRAKGMNVVQNLLPAHPNLKAIYCVNDEMAMGAIEALEMAGRLDEVIVSGIDANDDARQAVKDGKLAFTLYTNPVGQGADAVNAAKDLLEGKKVDKVIVSPVKLIDKDNVDQP